MGQDADEGPSPIKSNPSPEGRNGGGVLAFAHPAAFGVITIPRQGIAEGWEFLRRRRANKENKETEETEGVKDGGSGSESRADGGIDVQHPLCGIENGVAELVVEVEKSKDTSRDLKAEFNKLAAAKKQLMNDILRLERDKEKLTEKHIGDLARIREKLEAEAREGKRQLKEELDKGHDASMNQLRQDLRTKIEPLETETRRLRREVMRAQQADSLTASKSNGKNAGGKRGRFGKRGNGAAEPPAPAPAGDVVSMISMPTSMSFWRGLTDAFAPQDLLFNTGDDGGVREGGAVGRDVEDDKVPPPALLVLAAVPMFYLLTRWRANRQR